MICNRCKNVCEICKRKIKPQKFPEEIFIIVDRGKRDKRLQVISSAFVSQKDAEKFGVVEGRKIYKCKIVSNTKGNGGYGVEYKTY